MNKKIYIYGKHDIYNVSDFDNVYVQYTLYLNRERHKHDIGIMNSYNYFMQKRLNQYNNLIYLPDNTEACKTYIEFVDNAIMS